MLRPGPWPYGYSHLCSEVMPIGCDGVFRIGSATGADNRSQFIRVEGNMALGDGPACFIRGDDGVIGSGIDVDLPICQICMVPVVGETHTAGIEIPGIN
jgi:hypothetical protein